MGRRRGSGEEMTRARSGKEKGEAGGWTRRSGVGRGGGDRIGTMERRLGGGNGEGKMRGGNLKGEMGREATGRGRQEGGKGGAEEGARGRGILQMDMI